MAVQFKFTGDDKDVQRALERMEKQYNALIATTKKGTDETKKMAEAAKKAFEETRTPMERYKAKLEELDKLLKQGAIDAETFGRASKRAADELGRAEKSGGGMAANAMKSVAALLSVGGALSAINSELERKIQLEKTSADKQAERAKLTREALINLGTASPAERKEIFGGIAAISTRTGVKQSDLLAALPGLTSGQGGLDTKTMLSAAAMAARIAPHDMETMGSVALGLENTASLTGSADMSENMGFQLGLGRRSQVKSLKGINEYVIPGAIGVKGFGGSASEAAALVTALGIGMKDSEGRVQSTSGVSLAKQLKDLLPNMTPDEAVKYMQNNPAALRKFMAKGSFEQRAYIPTRDLLTPGTELARMYDVIKNETPTGAAASRTTQEFLSTLEGDAGQQDAASGRAIEAATEEMFTGNSTAARNARAREALMGAMDASGASWFEAKSAQWGFDFNVAEPEDAAISRLQARRAAMTQGMGADMLEKTGEKTQVDGIDRVIAELQGIKANQRNRSPKVHVE